MTRKEGMPVGTAHAVPAPFRAVGREAQHLTAPMLLDSGSVRAHRPRNPGSETAHRRHHRGRGKAPHLTASTPRDPDEMQKPTDTVTK